MVTFFYKHTSDNILLPLLTPDSPIGTELLFPTFYLTSLTSLTSNASPDFFFTSCVICKRLSVIQDKFQSNMVIASMIIVAILGEIITITSFLLQELNVLKDGRVSKGSVLKLEALRSQRKKNKKKKTKGAGAGGKNYKRSGLRNKSKDFTSSCFCYFHLAGASLVYLRSNHRTLISFCQLALGFGNCT